ncbi:HAD hydrolase family protein [Vibrio lentus]|nr:HAD hydrolase family protein [Vibrio lentus]
MSIWSHLSKKLEPFWNKTQYRLFNALVPRSHGHAEVSKGHTLGQLLQSLNLTLENCVAFGDGMNDAEMLMMAGKV